MRTASLVVPVVLGSCGLIDRNTLHVQSPTVPPETAPVNVLVSRVTMTSYWPLATFQRIPQRSVLRAVELTVTVLVLTRLMPPEKVRPDALLNPVHDVSPTKRYATENCTVPVTVLLLLLTPKRPPPKIRSSEISVVFACVVRVPESV